MNKPFTNTLQFKQQDFPDKFKFYFNPNNKKSTTNNDDLIRDLSRPRLKIAIVTETWPPEINGVALSLMQLCKGLQNQGHKILLIRPAQKVKCNDFKPNQECLVNGQSIPKYPDMKFGWPQFLKVSQAISAFTPDVVHIVTEGPLGFTALHAAKTRRIPVSSGFHSQFQEFSRFFDLAFLVKPIQSYLRWFHNATHLTCVPSRDTEQALREFGVTCPLVVVGRGIDTERFSSQRYSEQLRQQWGADENTTVLIYVGRLSSEKEVNVVIEAYTALRKQSQRKVKLVLVGDGPDRNRLEKMQGAEHVIFMGSLSGTQLAEAYASANVFVFASQVETFGNVVIEAMASGLPIIAYDYACAQLHGKHTQTGWLCSIGDIQQLTQHVLHIPDNSTLKRMGQQAMRDVQSIGWQHPVQQFEEALYQVTQYVKRLT
ncbi:glycosyltransferase family 1 protein [Acinetobacter sp.]|jgi:glycosyltransferase involved in cell wall biosynthesis|uniref:glycosyltransferase family 4 protein n=1 Tax=Acinetobacter sp. TaxID=472 RepID=UPI0028252724|nr:glycosyltransferase family 1 protein [Acinetobacter sp.]MDR0234708.1 glycosyltransferase family 1 protein [Acinetobacter sp.]